MRLEVSLRGELELVVYRTHAVAVPDPLVPAGRWASVLMLTGALGLIMKGGESAETNAVTPRGRKAQLSFDICIM